MPFQTIAGEDIFYSLCHAPTDRAFVLVHGAGGDHTHWPQALRASALASVYGLDLPGHGHSGGAGRADVEAYADFIQDFVKQLKLKRVTVFGHSMGGAISLCLALRRPDWLDAIVVVGTGARLRVAPAILDTILADFQTFLDLAPEFNFGPNTAQELVSQIRTGFAKTDPHVIHGDFTACNRFDRMQDLHRITLPTLIVNATHDQLTPLKYGQYLHDHISDSQLHIIENAGHMMALERPVAFMEGIETFFGLR
jgi:pimeloyl-ACP methyl ester carboxylesterase